MNFTQKHEEHEKKSIEKSFELRGGSPRLISQWEHMNWSRWHGMVREKVEGGRSKCSKQGHGPHKLGQKRLVETTSK